MIERERVLGQVFQKTRNQEKRNGYGGQYGSRNDNQFLNHDQNFHDAMNGDDDQHSGGDWQEVTVKKKKQSLQERGRVDDAAATKFLYGESFSFYFTEFPETHGAKEMLKAFRLYGEAVEVVIPPKRDKRGKRFGFVRFNNVDDPRVFAVRLDNIIFGATKIHVNIPRFQRELPRSSNYGGLNHAQRLKEKQPVERIPVQRDTESFRLQKKVRQVWRKKVIGGGGGGELGSQRVDRRVTNGYEETRVPRLVYHRKNNLAEVCYNVSEEDMQKFKKMYIGTVRTPGTTYYVQEWFHMQGFFSIKFTPIGANKVLMEEMDDGVFQELLSNHKDWFYEKFDDIRSWEPDAVDNERIVWVRCHGIPLHAWNDEFFASLARNFGEYLGVDDATRTKSAMDIARIRLRSNGYDVFNAVVTANINGSLFHVKMTEEWCGPL